MFHSVPRRPICDICVNTVKLHGNRSFRRTVEQGKGKMERVPWFGSGVSLLLAWLQKASPAGSGPKRKGLLSIFADHCSFLTGQRLRRACQVAELYSNLYSDRTRRTVVGTIWRRFQSKHAPTGRLVAAMAGIFMWDKEKIQDDEIRRFALSLFRRHAFFYLLSSGARDGSASLEILWPLTAPHISMCPCQQLNPVQPVLLFCRQGVDSSCKRWRLQKAKTRRQGRRLSGQNLAGK